MRLNMKFLGVVLAVLLVGGAYWLGSFITSAQMGMPSQTQVADPMIRMASAMERMASAMERMGGMSSSGMGMMSGMMGGSGMAGQTDPMDSMMQDMQTMMEQMMQSQPIASTGQLAEVDLTRTSMGAAIAVAATFMNPLLKPEEAAGKLVFKIVLDTHSDELMQYDLTKLVVLRNSEGVAVDKGFTWEPQSESDHHRTGLLKIDAAFNGKQILTSTTKSIELELKSIGIPSRLFSWEEAFLGKAKP